jgi:hypothetical protein
MYFHHPKFHHENNLPTGTYFGKSAIHMFRSEQWPWKWALAPIWISIFLCVVLPVIAAIPENK